MNAEDKNQRRFKSPSASIYYYQEEVSRSSYSEKYLEKNLALSEEMINKIVYRVKLILGMHPQDLNFGVMIYLTHEELKEAFSSMGLTGDVPLAFYSHKDKTIFLSSENLNERILVHEIAHAVMNAYFTPQPPRHVQEILAHYVEKHYLY